ncbi:MAG: DUF362 domain-containing protein [Patescibacteria group bacterium]|nr:DUF362 domain-containing protein [Patescibacteria group bacterium]MBU1876799.1 DUF362 domain-containing protein [Patescibacteria group bacterium]
MALVSKIKVQDNLKEAIEKAVEQIGGFGQFIKNGDQVLLKPNFNTADPFPASTDPAFLKAVVELVYRAGASEVIIGDCSTMTAKTRQVMEKLGIFDFEKEILPAPKILVFEERKWVKKKIPKAKYLKSVNLTEILDKVDKLILLPCLKTHFLAQFTGSLKIAVGFMKPIERLRLHAGHLNEKIAELNSIIDPDFIIMDGRKCFITKGPSKGGLAEPGLILASESRTAIDIEGIKIIQSFKGNSLAGLRPEDFLQIKRAKELGIK